MHPLIAEAGKKAAVSWLTVPGAGQPYPVWGLWAEEALHIVSGDDEQAAPGLAEAATAAAVVNVTMSGDHGGRVVRWPAKVTALAPDSPEWAAVATPLAGKRLNAVGSAEQTVERWATKCQIFRLAPAGDPDEAGSTLPDVDLAAPPRPSPALRQPTKPFRLHRVRKN